MNDKGLLLIHYYFPPIHSIGVLRNFHLAKAYQNKFSNIKVLTTSNRNILPKNPQDLSGFDIEELATQDYRSNRTQSVHFQEGKKNKILFKFAVKAINTYPINIWKGEGGRKYIVDGIKKGIAYLEKNPEAIIYTSFRPFSDLYIGYKLKRRFPKTKWVVDFRDLPIDPIYKNVLFPETQHKFYKNILKSSDLIVTVSQGLKNSLSTYNARVIPVYNGIKFRKTKKQYSDKFKINYTGSLFGEERDPSIFFQWIQDQSQSGAINLKDLVIGYAGKDSKQFLKYIKKFELESIYSDYGMVDHETALALQDQSEINLLLTIATKDHQGILTGKVFEYMASLKPIVVVIKGCKDLELASIMKTYGEACIFSKEGEEGKKILAWYQAWKNKQVVLADHTKIEKEFSWQNAVSQITKALNQNA